ncbi:MAG TPA: hypothetical protein VJ203_10065 [Bacteroidales bacterium]|nr:hypothetical protein [Bacteroidales bacterium]
MKKLLVLTSIMAFCVAGMAASPSNAIRSAKGERVNCKRISIGTQKARITMPDGEKRVMQIDQLDSYTVNGQIFEKKELYVNGKSTGRVAFMQLIGVRGNLKIYKNVAFDPELVTADKKRNDFYVYMGEEVYLDVDRKALPNVLNFFGLKWSYM